jgi:hypothetical protein
MDELEQDAGHLLEEAASKVGVERRAAVLEALVSAISKALALRPDELAILMLGRDRTLLEFVYPFELAEGGINKIPLSVPSLAGRVAKTGHSVLTNAAQDVRHLDFYERIRIKEERPRKIQKLLAVGVNGPEGKVRAVIEVSRRGDALVKAGPDFRPEEQQCLERLAAIAAPALAAAFEWTA